MVRIWLMNHYEYPLVNVNKQLWKDPPFYSWENSLFLWPFSIAIMTNYQRLLSRYTPKKIVRSHLKESLVRKNLDDSMVSPITTQCSTAVIENTANGDSLMECDDHRYIA